MSDPQIDIESLNVEQRLRLIERLWDSLSPSADSIPLTDAQRAELDRRLDELDGGDTAGIPWQVVLDRLRSRMG